MEGYGLTVTEAASLLKVSRPALSNLLNEKADMSPEMAWKIAIVFGGTPDIWIRLQSKVDLAKAHRKISKLKLKKYHE